MDPYLEHPGLWPDVNHGLIEALRDALAVDYTTEPVPPLEGAAAWLDELLREKGLR